MLSHHRLSRIVESFRRLRVREKAMNIDDLIHWSSDWL